MTFMEFDSFEQATEWMARATDEANANLHPSQRAITWGSHWARHVAEWDIVIIGYVWTLEENEASIRRHSSPEDDPEGQIERLKEAHERGYLFGRCYSDACVDGELGDTHRANMMPLTLAEFEQAAEVYGFDVSGKAS